MAAERVICDLACLLLFMIFSVGCIHQLPAFQKSLHSSRNCSSRLLYDQWMMYLDRFSVLNLAFFCFSFVQNYNLRVGFRRLSLPLKVRNLENMCIRWIYLSDLPREFLWRLIWMRDICLIAFFLSESFFTETTGVFAAYWSSFERPTIVNPEKKQG